MFIDEVFSQQKTAAFFVKYYLLRMYTCIKAILNPFPKHKSGKRVCPEICETGFVSLK